MPVGLKPYMVVTYRYLRIAMVAVLIGLAVSVTIQSVDPWCWLGSVSAYYYTPVHAVFIGSLFVFGAALIAYRGHSPQEEAVLNLSGVMAFVVAIVPTVQDNKCQLTDGTAPADEVWAGAKNNILSLMIAGVVALGIATWFAQRERRKNRGHSGASLLGRDHVQLWASQRPRALQATTERVAKEPWGITLKTQSWIEHNWAWLKWVLWLVPVLELGLFALFPGTFLDQSHTITASTMVFGLVLVMIFNAWFSEVRGEDPAGKFRRRYQWLALALVVAVAGAFVATRTFDGQQVLVLILEFAILGIFVVYWLFQTAELWGYAVPAKETNNDDHGADTESAARKA